jgi:dTDP-4-amino-4,6-dideoxygalactose transaminase
MLVTNDEAIYERAAAFGHYERTSSLALPDLKRFAGLPLGGHKYRMHQVSSAVGRVQLRLYRERMEEIQRAMNCFWDLLEGAPGIRAHRPVKDSGSTMGDWYAARGLYVREELAGLSVHRFREAVRAEGVTACNPGANLLLHLHPLLNEADVYGHGKPTRPNALARLRDGAGCRGFHEGLPPVAKELFTAGTAWLAPSSTSAALARSRTRATPCPWRC